MRPKTELAAQHKEDRKETKAYNICYLRSLAVTPPGNQCPVLPGPPHPTVIVSHWAAIASQKAHWE